MDRLKAAGRASLSKIPFIPAKWRPRKAQNPNWPLVRLPSTESSPQRSLEDLALLARDLPDKWACDTCHQLHDARRRDTPQKPWKTPCPWGQKGLSRTCGNKSFLIGRQHVQLALKYDRIWGNRSQRRHSRKLMAPHRAESSILSDTGKKISVRYSACPRLYAKRYLLCSNWRYRMKDDSLNKQRFAPFAPCEHNSYRIDTHGIPSLFTPQPGYFTLEEALEVAASKERSTWTVGRCSRCPTEIGVCVEQTKVLVRAWQDLGTEDSALESDGWKKTRGLGYALEIYACYMKAYRRDMAEAARRAAAVAASSTTDNTAADLAVSLAALDICLN